ncbi:MAG: hypothetical protein DRH08_14305 [Deltaproteobacteria bacterium]|nr:MAG: hypothetical protein DRH08_14305 [Deltaproteobacteria bacterium]
MPRRARKVAKSKSFVINDGFLGALYFNLCVFALNVYGLCFVLCKRNKKAPAKCRGFEIDCGFQAY